jgi:hypothetical protein
MSIFSRALNCAARVASAGHRHSPLRIFHFIDASVKLMGDVINAVFQVLNGLTHADNRVSNERA